MTNRNAEARFHGHTGITIGTRPLCYRGGVLPEDFVVRLVRLKEASGLTWSAFAHAIGVDGKQMRRWRKKGVEPSGGAMLSLFRFATQIPGGLEILMGEDFQVDLLEDEQEGD